MALERIAGRPVPVRHSRATRRPRDLIRAGTGDGRIRAKAAGKKFGRKPKLTTFQEMEIVRRRADGETVKDLARSYGVSHPSILRALERREEAA
jgi:DNA invertase Pin-like site-specific DNA recombinase